MLALFPVIPRRPMIEIRVARHPDDAAAVEAIFRADIARPTVGLPFDDDAPGNPTPGTALPGRDS
ncbi:putative histone acetyltransferase HPA8 [Burkholderia cepacia]|uniref:Histone acetyltransferase HPA8 n=2 Tax=Burkholderia cepacia TaxID=292 RepID=A0AA88Z082_BURCE|nr:putative histone acetyltransferase HPA8 [Burkholderia cepacia]